MHQQAFPRRLCPTGNVLPAAWWNHGKTTVCQGVYVQKARQQPQARYALGVSQHFMLHAAHVMSLWNFKDGMWLSCKKTISKEPSRIFLATSRTKVWSCCDLTVNACTGNDWKVSLQVVPKSSCAAGIIRHWMQHEGTTASPSTKDQNTTKKSVGLMMWWYMIFPWDVCSFCHIVSLILSLPERGNKNMVSQSTIHTNYFPLWSHELVATTKETCLMHQQAFPRRLCPTNNVLPAAWWNHGKTTVCQGVYVQKARQQPQARYALGNFQHSSNLFYMQPLLNLEHYISCTDTLSLGVYVLQAMFCLQHDGTMGKQRSAKVFMYKRHVSSLKQDTPLATFNTPLISSICNPSWILNTTYHAPIHSP